MKIITYTKRNGSHIVQTYFEEITWTLIVVESWKETHVHLKVKFEIDCDVKIAKEVKY